jgi:signal transduction histidine kinase
MVRESHRASQVIGGIRNLFTGADQGQEPIDVNEIALGALRILRGELKDHGITMRLKLTPDLPHVMGHGGQLQEVILNLVHNAIEAMDAIRDRSRVLRVITQRHDRDTIIVAVEDTGPGISAEKLDRIFDAFATTKRKELGLGLPISRMIVEHHGGQLSVQSDEKRHGALFQFTLPINSAAGSTAALL